MKQRVIMQEEYDIFHFGNLSQHLGIKVKLGKFSPYFSHGRNFHLYVDMLEVATGSRKVGVVYFFIFDNFTNLKISNMHKIYLCYIRTIIWHLINKKKTVLHHCLIYFPLNWTYFSPYNWSLIFRQCNLLS